MKKYYFTSSSLQYCCYAGSRGNTTLLLNTIDSHYHQVLEKTTADTAKFDLLHASWADANQSASPNTVLHDHSTDYTGKSSHQYFQHNR